MKPVGGTPPGPPSGLSVAVEVELQGATNGVRVEFTNADQAYAALLAAESQTQEISNLAPGCCFQR